MCSIIFVFSIMSLISVSNLKGQSELKKFFLSNYDDSQSARKGHSCQWTFGMAHRSFYALLSTLVCVCVGHQGHSFIFFVQWPSSSSFDRRQKKKQEVKSMFLLEYQWVQCVCVYWWERRTHLIRVWIEMNQQNHFFWHVCLLEKINIWFYFFFLFFYSHRSLNLIKRNGRELTLSVIESSVRWIRR